jgi:hypothetical protein
MTVTRFPGILEWQLLNKTESIVSGYPNTEQTSTSPPAATATLNSIETVSSVTNVNELSVESIQSTVDADGKTQYSVILPIATDGIK